MSNRQAIQTIRKVSDIAHLPASEIKARNKAAKGNLHLLLKGIYKDYPIKLLGRACNPLSRNQFNS